VVRVVRGTSDIETLVQVVRRPAGAGRVGAHRAARRRLAAAQTLELAVATRARARAARRPSTQPGEVESC
jgi:hypothetical protein